MDGFVLADKAGLSAWNLVMGRGYDFDGWSMQRAIGVSRMQVKGVLWASKNASKDALLAEWLACKAIAIERCGDDTCAAS